MRENPLSNKALLPGGLTRGDQVVVQGNPYDENPLSLSDGTDTLSKSGYILDLQYTSYSAVIFFPPTPQQQQQSRLV